MWSVYCVHNYKNCSSLNTYHSNFSTFFRLRKLEYAISFTIFNFPQSINHTTTLQTSQDFSRILKNEKESKMDFKKWFCYQDRRTEKKILHSKSHVFIKRQKIRNIMSTIFLTVICPAIRHLENVRGVASSN